MNAIQGWFTSIILALLLVITTVVWTEEDKTVVPSLPEILNSGRKGKTAKFIVPDHMTHDVDSFTYGAVEYLAINRKRRVKTAELLCKMEYYGKLAILDDNKKAMFMAEALSETNLILDSLWIAGRRIGNGTQWEWVDGDDKPPIDPALVKNFSKVIDVHADNRNCLAFARLDHDLPDYRELSCNAQRAVLCERPKGAGEGNSTHPGWIKLGQRLYKVFPKEYTYDEAQRKCFELGVEVQLAVLINYNYSQLLGRYLLIGRPSLENAWIGAKWLNSQFMFEPEPIVLPNETTITNGMPWPPWRNNVIQKKTGCLLLDRHLTNITLFVEAPCTRHRGYICYKLIDYTSGDESSDIIINDNGYRIHFKKRPWLQAYNFCLNKYKYYGAYLTEIQTPEMKFELLYVMGENRSAIQHIWLGGYHNHIGVDKGWIWKRKQNPINLEILDWVQNKTYNENVEEGNVCLNMDRENHIRGLHYGTNCEAYQTFVCYFTKDKLLELREWERKQIIQRYGD